MRIQAAQVEGKHGESDMERIPMIKMSHDKGVNSFLQVYPWLIFVILDKKKNNNLFCTTRLIRFSNLQSESNFIPKRSDTTAGE